MSNNRIGTDGGQIVADSLRKNGYLRSLSLTETAIDQDTATKISHICKNKGITLAIMDEEEDEEDDEEVDEGNGRGEGLEGL